MQLLVTVKAYPEISRRKGETVCVAGIRIDRAPFEWVRLWPIPFREMDLQFAKYQIIELEAEPSTSDPRPESYKPNVDSLQLGEVITGPSPRTWEPRRRYVEPLIHGSMCELLRRQELDGTSLGVFRPGEVLDLAITDDVEPWDETQTMHAHQLSLLAPEKAALEWIPYRFRYHYRCDEPGCPTHRQSIVDWEIKALYRRVRDDDNWEDAIRGKWLDDLCGPDRDTAFFVGNMHRSPKQFLVLGVWWPPVDAQTSLLDGLEDQGR